MKCPLQVGISFGQRTLFKRNEIVAKPELGTKRTCLECGTRFFDLNKDPIVCPKCGTPFKLEEVVNRIKAKGRARHQGAPGNRGRRRRTR